MNEQALNVAADLDLGPIPVPDTYDQAKASDQSAWWKASMDKEIEDLLKHRTWDLVDRCDVPNGRKVTKSRWSA